MGLSRKKVENPKIEYTCFFVLQYFEPFGSLATSNFSMYSYMYKMMVILWPPCWRYGGGSFTQKDRKSRIRVYVFFILQYFELFGSHPT